MTHRLIGYLFTGITATLLSFGTIAAQTVADTTTPQAETPVSQTVTLDKGPKQEIDFELTKLGSIIIKIYQDAQEAATTNQEDFMQPGIRGVKINLRSRDIGFENWVIEQYTDDAGTYTFDCLSPGKYKIEIDASTLPADLVPEKP
jgi:hypothetical protein